MVTAISVSISGGNHSASGTNPRAEAISEIECPTVNDVTMTMSGRSRRNGTTRQSRNSRWPGPARMCQKPDSTRARPAGREEAQRGGDVLQESVDGRADRKRGAVGADFIFQQHIEQLLVPVQVNS